MYNRYVLLFILKRQNCANDVFILFADNKIDIQFLKRPKGFLSVRLNMEVISNNKLQPESNKNNQWYEKRRCLTQCIWGAEDPEKGEGDSFSFISLFDEAFVVERPDRGAPQRHV